MFRGVDGAGFIAPITITIMGCYHMLQQSVVAINDPWVTGPGFINHSAKIGFYHGSWFIKYPLLVPKPIYFILFY